MQPELVKPARADAHHGPVVRRVSRRQADESHGGGAWKVAFADFCLALLCLFLVLWLLATRHSERMQVVLQSAGANLIEEGQGLTNSLAAGSRGSMIERHPVPARSEELRPGNPNRGSPERALRPSLDTATELRELERRVQRIAADEGLAGNLRSSVTAQGLRLMLHDTDARGMFERGSAVPNLRLRALLTRLAPLLAEIRNQLLIVGHTDATQYQDRGPSAFSNWALSNHRAMAARHHLLLGGMPESSVLQVSGMADAAPLDEEEPKSAVNRRIELLVLTGAQSRALAAMYGPLPQAPAERPEQQLRALLPGEGTP